MSGQYLGFLFVRDKRGISIKEENHHLNHRYTRTSLASFCIANGQLEQPNFNYHYLALILPFVSKWDKFALLMNSLFQPELFCIVNEQPMSS